MGSDPLKTRLAEACPCFERYLELGMLDDAALVLEEIEPEDKTRSEILGARVGIYLAAKKWTWPRRWLVTS
jgi:hypothetical protein